MSRFHHLTTLLKTVIAVSSTALVLTGCGGGGGGSSKPPVTSSSTVSSLSSTVSSLSSDQASNSSISSASSEPSSSASSESSSNVSSESSSSSAPVSTTYNITVDVPESLLTPPSENEKTTFGYRAEKTAGSDVLTASNFAVACVDLAGTVLEVIPLEDNNITSNDDGSWSITVPLEPSINCLVVANLHQSLDLQPGDSINDSGNIYAPASAESITVSPLSTAAFNNFVEELGGSGTFESVDINPRDPAKISAIENVMTNITALLANQDFSESTLVELLNAIQEFIAPFIEQEVSNIQNPVASTAAELIRDGGGMYNFSSRWEGIIYTAWVGDTTSYGLFDNGEFVSRDTNRDLREYILSSDGWVEAARADVLSSYNGDGSVTYVDSSADGLKTSVHITQGFNLAGTNIANLLSANGNTTEVSEIVKPDAVFSEGAIGYRISIISPVSYSVSINTGETNGTCFFVDGMSPDDANGNCNMQELRRDNNIFERPIVDYETLFSPDVDINAVGSRSLAVGAVSSGDLVVAQLINNSSKTVKYYARAWDSGGEYASLLGTGTWTEITLPNLSENNRAVRFDYPRSVLDVANIWAQQTYQAYTVHNGYVRHLDITLPSSQPSGILVFNKTARDDIMNALKK